MRKSLSYKIIIPVIGFFLAISYLFAVEGYEEGRLRIRITDIEYKTIYQEFYDDEINETFDYSQIYRKEVVFYQKMNSSEFSISEAKEIEELVFVDLEEIYQLLREHDIPNIVVGFVRFLCNGSYEEVYLRYYKRPHEKISRYMWSTIAFYSFGSYSGIPHKVTYTVERPFWEDGIHIVITKRFLRRPRELGSTYIWSLDAIQLYGTEPPIIKALFTRYPYQIVIVP